MKKLTMPLENRTPRSIFIDCVKNCKDKAALEQCADLVQTDSEKYMKLAPLRLDQFHYHRTFPGGVTGERLKDVYTNLFVRRKEDYYDQILYADGLWRCPICGISEPSTLDHYLPKSVVPTLAVTPANLIPLCDKCNKNKLDQMETAAERTPFHLYLEEPPQEPWLAVELVLGQKLAARYGTRCPAGWDPVTVSRVQQHLTLYGLKRRYSQHAAEELEKYKRKWAKLLSENGENALRHKIRENRQDEEESDPNSWKAALYRGLEEQLDVLIKWLQSAARAAVAG